ncbi:winged helix-turn-helix transcriptional regulator [Taibaiella koreensis]|uniref:winged helix-turn-helix transcriptional regulator n=1 Tax=Taibaiella koreensis TaxID=1268548 RepID=UPI000E59CF2B|nr:helix-turn-helix domain-containing protein [Taibaiella koreensis]
MRYERKIPIPIECGLHLTKEVLGGKWKMSLINAIHAGIKRPARIEQAFPTLTKRVLSRQLKELEAHGIISKEIFPQLPPKVEYSLTPLGASLLPIIDMMDNWGNENRSFLEKVIEETRLMVEIGNHAH